MTDQDLVADRLMRTPIDQMHGLVAEYGDTIWSIWSTWPIIVQLPETAEFLLSHGWAIADYVEICKNSMNKDIKPHWLCYYFAFYKHPVQFGTASC